MQYPDGDTLLQPLSTMGGTPTGLQYFINYINVLEGAKARIKNLHWGAKNLPNADEVLKQMSERRPIGRLGKEEEIAFAILFAACDEAGYMTGSIISIDGGFTA